MILQLMLEMSVSPDDEDNAEQAADAYKLNEQIANQGLNQMLDGCIMIDESLLKDFTEILAQLYQLRRRAFACAANRRDT